MTTTTSGSAATAPVDEHVVAVYDPKDGRILHLHTFLVFGGNITEDEAVEEALVEARRHGRMTEDAKTLHTKQAPGGGMYRVDLGTLTLVPVEPPSHTSRPAKSAPKPT